MSEKYIYCPSAHNAETLSRQLLELPQNFGVAGSVGRCAYMGTLKSLKRRDGSSIDIDVVDISGQNFGYDVMTDSAYRVDAGLTKAVRPIDEESWGVFLPSRSELVFTIPRELCEPVKINPVWADSEVSVLPAALQKELMTLNGDYYKSHTHKREFLEWCFDNEVDLPRYYQQAFENYRFIRQEEFGHFEKTYRKLRRFYLQNTPVKIKRMVNHNLGPLVRKIRHTAKT